MEKEGGGGEDRLEDRRGARHERDRDARVGIRVAGVQKLEAKELHCSILGKCKDRPKGHIALVS